MNFFEQTRVQRFSHPTPQKKSPLFSFSVGKISKISQCLKQKVLHWKYFQQSSPPHKKAFLLNISEKNCSNLSFIVFALPPPKKASNVLCTLNHCSFLILLNYFYHNMKFFWTKQQFNSFCPLPPKKASLSNSLSFGEITKILQSLKQKVLPY